MNNPKTETWYVWKTFEAPYPDLEGVPTWPPRLLTPWGDPHLHAHPANSMFRTTEEAREWKSEYAPYENWWLVKMTLEPLEFHKSEEEPDEEDHCETGP